MGHLTLSCAETDQEISCGAVEALRAFHRFILVRQSKRGWGGPGPSSHKGPGKALHRLGPPRSAGGRSSKRLWGWSRGAAVLRQAQGPRSPPWRGGLGPVPRTLGLEAAASQGFSPPPEQKARPNSAVLLQPKRRFPLLPLAMGPLPPWHVSGSPQSGEPGTELSLTPPPAASSSPSFLPLTVCFPSCPGRLAAREDPKLRVERESASTLWPKGPADEATVTSASLALGVLAVGLAGDSDEPVRQPSGGTHGLPPIELRGPTTSPEAPKALGQRQRSSSGHPGHRRALVAGRASAP